MEERLMEERKHMLLDLMKDPTYVPMKMKELAMLLGVPKEQRRELEEVLNELVVSGKVGISKKGKYARSEVFAQTGTFTAHHRGFGFVTIEGREDDLFIPPDDTGDAMDGDTVQVIINENGRGGRTEARVLKVLKHANETLIGTFEKNKNFGFVIPDNPRITMDVFIPQGKENGAVSGHKVVVKLDTYATGNKNPEGHVKEILGHINDPGVDILSIVRAYGLPEEFPEAVMEEVARVPELLSPEYVAGEIEKNGRVDLRKIPMVTIDGEEPGIHTKSVISYLPDKPYFADWMKITDLLELFEDFYEDFDRARAEKMCQELGIDTKLKMKTLSKGNKEKVQLVLVMSRQAKLYLLDEPIAGVDPAARDFILSTILNNYNPDGTVLISTHLIADVERVLDEVIFLKDGQIVRQEQVDDIREKEGMSVDELFRQEFRAVPFEGGEWNVK